MSSLLSLLLSACGDDIGPVTTATAPDYPEPSEGPAGSQAVPVGDGGLTPEELAFDPEPPAASDPPTEQVEVEGGEAVDTASEVELDAEGVTQEPDAVTELDWDALIPEEWQPDKIMAQYNVDELEDDDPRAQELMEKLQALWKRSPVVQDLDGRRVKLPGFVVPLETDGQKTGEFLLVPYYGACIHVPPPPANQTVHVVTGTDREYQGGLFDPVWVSGTLKVESSSSDLAEAGYRLEATRVERYE